MGGENRSRDGGPGVRSAHDGRTPAESPDFRARATAEVLLLDDANARAAAAYSRALHRCKVVRNIDVARRYGLSSDTVVRDMRDGTRVVNAARLLQGTRAEFEELRLEHVDVWGDPKEPTGGDPMRAMRAVIQAGARFTDRAMEVEAHGVMTRDDAEALSDVVEKIRAALRRFDAAALPVIEGRR